jgi:hypothetical protein
VKFDSIRSQIERRSGGKFHSRPCLYVYRAANRQSRLAKLLKQQYGMTVAEYTAMLQSQGGVCGICRCLPEQTGLRRLVVDHDHATGRVRGLICQSCNLGLGRFKDDPSILVSAIKYLGRHSGT